jgi:DNA-binding SARP family transcriptional activator
MGVPGNDVSDARRAILRRSAERLFVRAFGPLTVHRKDWEGPVVRIEKRRLRHLMGLLVANQHRTLTREMALDMLWPDSDPGGSVNNLNQAVFHLRRLLNEGSRDPDRPQYIISNSDALSFDPELIRTDLDEVRRLAPILRGATTTVSRRQAAESMLGLIRGEFLADLRYEDWASGIQMSVTAEIREPLLELAGASPADIPPHLSLRAAELLAEFDPFDESAHVAMARKLYEVGRRAAARRLITTFAASVEQELDVPASPDVQQAMLDLGAATSTAPVH